MCVSVCKSVCVCVCAHHSPGYIVLCLTAGRLWLWRILQVLMKQRRGARKRPGVDSRACEAVLALGRE